jgi:hypothetical protein
MQDIKLVGPDGPIIRTVRAEPGIPVERLVDRLHPEWAPSWTRERVRRLGQVGLIRLEREPRLVCYPVGEG